MHPLARNKILVVGVLILAAVGSFWFFHSKPDPKSVTSASKSGTGFNSGTTSSSELGSASSSGSRTVSGIGSQSGTTSGSQPNSGAVSKSGSESGSVSVSGSSSGSATSGSNVSVGAVGAVPGAQVGSLNPAQDQNNAAKTQAAALPAPKIADGCFTVTYYHKKLSSHSDGEACLKHKNLITLKHPEQAENVRINPKSVCVRVNGAAVKFTQVPNKNNQVVIGPEAGPNAKITARFCIGKSSCNEDCVVKKDEFLSALGADDNNDSNAVDWDGSKGVAQEDAELEGEMAKLNGQAEKRDGSDLFDGWVSENHTMACEQKNNGSKKVAHLHSN